MGNPFEIHGEAIQIPWVVHSESFQNRLGIHSKSMGNPFKIHGETIQNRWRQDVLLSLGTVSAGLELANHMDAPYLRQDSTGFWIIVDKGRPKPRWLPLIGTL